MLERLLPRDVIACITLGGGFLLLLSGIDGIVGSMLLAVTFFYFGAESLEKRKRDGEKRDWVAEHKMLSE